MGCHWPNPEPGSELTPSNWPGRWLRKLRQDEFELVSPLPFEPSVLAGIQPANLRCIYSKPNVLQRRWWTIGLPLYMRSHPFELFHGTNYEVPLRAQCPTVVTIHDLSLLLHSSTHEARAVRRARLLLPLMARQAKLIITPSELVKSEVCEHLEFRREGVCDATRAASELQAHAVGPNCRDAPAFERRR